MQFAVNIDDDGDDDDDDDDEPEIMLNTSDANLI